MARTFIIIILAIFLAFKLYPQDRLNSLGAFFDYGTIQYRGELGNQLGKFAQWQGGYGLGLSYYLSPSFNVGLRSGYNYLSINNSETPPLSMFGNSYTVTGSIEYKFSNGYLLKENDLFQPYLKTEIGMMYGRTWGKSQDLNGMTYSLNLSNACLYLGGGSKIRLGTKLQTFIEFGNFLTSAVGIDGAKSSPNKDLLFRINAGVILLFGRMKDSDNDDVADKIDLCPDTPKGVIVDEIGCPIDRDNDRIADYLDQCPDEYGTNITRGCPDRDGDGIPDKDDECPNEPGIVENKGCPDIIPEIEPIFKEQKLPAGMTYDSDGDGIADHIDECPNIPGSLENRGCPPVAKVARWKTDIVIPPVHFTSGGTFITDFSRGRLNRLIEFLNENPTLNVWMFGHTDAIGSSDINQKISEIRVEIVANYLIEKGISPARIHSIGFGESFPVSFGRTSADMLRNRRIEFYLFEFK
ncbi:OmpA family protein [Roseimarinus sediminis]|uniref:OmpA family protein n=1 Tax=Roseimarinus sediminis TaxID=1610899 RepID=UPI003D2507D8